MKNNYFKFKQFTIQQGKSSMKVCTDSCLFGSWVADKFEQKIINPATILDVGAGTGLLGLMVAQKSQAQIEGIEIDKNAFEQMVENFNQSPWNSRLKAIHQNMKDFTSEKKYELIISNPPFFENDLESNMPLKNLAKHSSGFTIKDLFPLFKNTLTPGGKIAILLPYHRIEFFKNAAVQNNYFVQEQLLVKQTQHHDYFRSCLLLGTEKGIEKKSELIIKKDSGNYTPEFIQLLKDYYLSISL